MQENLQKNYLKIDLRYTQKMKKIKLLEEYIGEKSLRLWVKKKF